MHTTSLLRPLGWSQQHGPKASGTNIPPALTTAPSTAAAAEQRGSALQLAPRGVHSRV
jgi:hypothetical protein